MKVGLGALAMLALGSAATGQTPSVQQAFDAAVKTDASGTPTEREAAWTALDARPGLSRRTHAIIRLRQGAALRDLGQRDAAEAALRSGLADLPAVDATLAVYRTAGWTDLGIVEEQALDYASAAHSFTLAEKTAADDEDRLAALIGLIRTATFVDPAEAAAAVARADALAGKATPATRSAIRRYDAELRLNRGDIAGARAAAGEAVKLDGGLTEHTRITDVPARSDYAIAALLAGREDEAREYMAMTGAGRLTKGQFAPVLEATVPDCGGEDGLKPSDMAVVEFSVGDDGAVMLARPVYAAGGGAVALAFARAVNDWSWTPEQVKAMPAFFRYLVRVELRCSTAFQRPSVGTYLDGQLAHWLLDKGVEPLPAEDRPEAAALPVDRAALAAAERADGPEALALVPHLHRLAGNRTLPRDERLALLRREAAILAKAGAGPTARLSVDVRLWAASSDERGRYFRDVVPTRIATNYAADPEARGAARLLVAEALNRWPDRVRAQLVEVTGDASLPDGSPVKNAAYVRLASLEQQAKHPDAARAAFAASHVAADQCDLIDSPPRLLSMPGADAFPQQALRWGFEGWTQVQFDIDAAGHATNQRAVASYPPFVFDDAGMRFFGNARYSKSYRPAGGLGCGGQSQRVRFQLPH